MIYRLNAWIDGNAAARGILASSVVLTGIVLVNSVPHLDPRALAAFWAFAWLAISRAWYFGERDTEKQG